MNSRSVAGVTLLELLVTLTLLGLLAGIAGLTFRTTPAPPALDATTARVAADRDSALRRAYPVSGALIMDGRAYDITAFPDGRVLTNAPIAIDPFTGRVRRGSR